VTYRCFRCEAYVPLNVIHTPEDCEAHRAGRYVEDSREKP